MKSVLSKTVLQSMGFALILTGLMSCGSSSNSPADPTPIPPSSPPTVAQESPLPLPVVNQNTLADAEMPADVIAKMGIGINLGNTLDAPNEGDWALAAEEYYIQAFQDAGFKHVRIPITWGNRIQEQAPYTIDADFLDRVELIVDWVLDRDMYAIINVHHDSWIKENYDDISQRNRFDTIWLTLSERFKNKSAKLLFEIINEPRGLSINQINQLNLRTMDIIRNQTRNRIIIYAGNEWSALDDLFNVAIPYPQDEYLIANFHSYDPWNFAGICVQPWGSEEDKTNMENHYMHARDWSDTNGIPIMMNEFGSAKFDFQNPQNVCASSERADYLRTSVAMIKKYGIAATFWDDGGSFSTYDRSTNTWGFEMEILTE
ncbi:glycoside hydrolase family 5 protein [Aliiglaciecola sp. M165]|uniref:glycoside hydrolase family 5 protein n=1 Tax=Aliiglaciecola sp. M165 TaxID=2593649 RepID=UPI0011804EF7|nr:glycoside hydrolase family 5 protein [Aliiglaciecola sp. M165]TRY31766.1 glycoside hydrolase family 5 protein [Aliiglaciecola sp. M165]